MSHGRAWLVKTRGQMGQVISAIYRRTTKKCDRVTNTRMRTQIERGGGGGGSRGERSDSFQ